jgi:glyoxylase I family protein
MDRGRFHVGIVVRRLEPMLHFYADILGFNDVADLEVQGTAIKILGLGDSFLKLVVLDQPPTTSSPPGGPAAGVAGLRYVTVRVANVAQTVERCVDAGLRVPMPPFQHEPGVTVAMVEDPEGNWVELIGNLSG